MDLGTDRFGFGYGGTGKKSNNKQFDSYGQEFGMNDVIGCYLNLDLGEIKYSKNGIDLGRAFSLSEQIKSTAIFPAVVLKVSLQQCSSCFCFMEKKYLFHIYYRRNFHIIFS